jgi:hypothetical protein
MKPPGISVNQRVVLFLLVVVLCVGSARAQNKLDARVLDEISQSRLLAQVRDLVGYGPRIGGTSSGDKSYAYVARRFKESGYKPFVIKDPSRLSFEFQRWALAVERPRELENLISHDWIGGFSPTVPETVSELTYLKDLGKFNRSAVNGKAILTSQPFSDKEYHRMAELGATCILEISPQLEEDRKSVV